MTENISFQDFMKMDLRMGKILSASRIEGTDKLVKMEVDIGTEKRTMVAGVADFIPSEELEGKTVPVFVNLEPKALRGVESRGMILMADLDGEPVLLQAVKEVPPGTRVR